MKKNLYIFLIVAIFVLAFILRFYQLGVVPNGLQQDETSIGYNSYSILQTGKDEYGTKYPLYFKAFGEYKLPGYIYLVVPSVAVFSLNEFAIRLPSAVFGFLTVVVFFFLVRAMFPKERLLHVIATFFLAITPWHLHFSRGAFEVVPALFFITLGVLLYVLFTDRKKLLLLVSSIVCLGISVYMYNTARLFVPLLFLYIFYDLYKAVKGKTQAQFLIAIGTGFIMLLPLFLSLFSSGGIAATKGTLLFSSAVTQAQILEIKSYLVAFPEIISKTLFNTLLLSFMQYFKNIALYFSSDFFFVNGSTHGNHGIGTVGMFYLFQLPLFIIGIWRILVAKIRWNQLLFYWVISVILVAALTREAPQATRSFFLIPPFVIFISYGLVYIVDLLLKMKNPILGRLLLVFGILLCMYNVLFYFEEYYIRFPIKYAKEWRAKDKDLSLFIEKEKGNFQNILIDKNAGFKYSSYVFYTAFLPSDFQQNVKRYPDDSEGFSEVSKIGNIEFREIDWSKDPLLFNTLIITTEYQKPKEILPTQTLFYPKRPVVTAVGQEILQYPTEDSAYVVIETK